MQRRALLGRGTERRALAALVEQAAAGSGGAVVVLSCTSGIRLRILAHGVLSFIYDTAMLGIAIGVISG